MSVQTKASPTHSSVSQPKTIRAMGYHRYGDPNVLQSIELPFPKRGAGQVTIAVKATSVNPIDYRMRRGEMKGLIPFGFPRIPGYDVAGVVMDCDVDAAIEPGDRVMAFLDDLRGGASAEVVVCGAGVVARMPDAMSFEEAAAIPLAATTALQSLKNHGKIATGQRVLINGASGGVGAFAIQIAKAFQTHVTAVASEDNEAFCRELGADCFFNYQKIDFTKAVESWDLIFDAAGKSSYFSARKVLKSGGHYVSTEPSIRGLFISLVSWPFSKTGRIMLAQPNQHDLETLISLYQQQQLSVTIDRRFSLTDIAAAHQRVETGVERGKVIVLNDQTDRTDN